MTFFIQATFIAVFVTEIKSHQVKIITKQVVEISNNSGIEKCLSNLLNDICASLTLDQQKVIYRLILVDNQVMQQGLQLPNIYLKQHDIETYIQHSLAKIFHTEQSLAYDYLIASNNDKYIFLTIYAHPQILVQHYLKIFTPQKLKFVGIAKHMVEHISDSEQTELFFEQIASLTNIGGINFLPWRETAKKAKRKLLLSVITSGIVLLITIIFYLFWQISQQQNQQLSQNKQLHEALVQKTLELSSLINLDKQITQLKLDISIRQRLHNQLISIVNYFIVLSTTAPDGVWFNGLSYRDNKIELKGDSFSYTDILAFAHLLNEHDMIEHAQIISVKKYYDLLQFDIDIQFIQSD